MNEQLTSLRAFGMTGAQLSTEISLQEKRLELSLSIVEKRAVRKIVGYDQFENDIRSCAAIMSEFYEIFYCLEVSIRRLISAMLEDSEGNDWWNSGRIEETFRSAVSDIKKKEKENSLPPRSDNNLDYLTFGQLGNIITGNFDLFQTVLKSKVAVSKVFSQLNALRNPIAHHCELAPDDGERLRLSVLDWFRLFN